MKIGAVITVGALVMLALAAPATARTRKPTATPSVPWDIRAEPNPARSGQVVDLSTTYDGELHGRWTQILGPTVILENFARPRASFVVPPIAEATTLRFRYSLLTVDAERDIDVTILPALAVSITVPRITGPPGGSTLLDVQLDSMGLPVATVRHELAFDPEASIATRDDGTPDCDAADGVSGTFSFAPDGCGDGVPCDQLRADLTFSDPPTTPGPAYRCVVALSALPATSCVHPLQCVGGDATATDGETLPILCTDGSATSQYPTPEPQFALQQQPDVLQVGTPALLTFTVSRSGGLPHFELSGLSPFFDGSDITRDVISPREVTYVLQPVLAGNALLQVSLIYEITTGCPGNEYYEFSGAASPLYTVPIEDPAGVRVSGRVAEMPSCAGAAGGVEVRLQPGNRTMRTDESDGSFSFDGVSPGAYSLEVPMGCNLFGCWSSHALVAGGADLALDLCPVAVPCAGDCDGDRQVTIDELIAGIAMALDSTVAPPCGALDTDASGSVLIDELLRAVSGALDGCPLAGRLPPTPSPSPTPTPLPES